MNVNVDASVVVDPAIVILDVIMIVTGREHQRGCECVDTIVVVVPVVAAVTVGAVVVVTWIWM